MTRRYIPVAHRGWLGRPQLRTGERGHRQATWFELFYDLAFVVIVGQISLLVVADPSWRGVGQAALLFVPVWWAWVGEVFYTTRFDADTDRAKRLIGTLQLIALTLLAASIARGGPADLRAIAGAYALVRTLQLAEIWRAGRFIPEARPLTRHFLIGYGSGVALWWVGVALPVRWGAWLWGIGLLIEVLTYVRGARFHRRYPPHVSHLPERYGLFTILVLGEIFIGAVAGAATQHAGWSAAVLVAFAVAGAAAMWWIYFDRIDSEAIVALSQPGTASQRPFVIWLFAHMPIAFGLALTGAGVDLLLHAESEHSSPSGLILIAGQIIYVLAEAVVCATAVGAGPPQLRLTHGVAVRIIAAAALVVVAALDWWTHSALLTLALSAAVLWAVVVYDFVRGRRVGAIE